MRKIIAALQTSVDGFIEGPNGELDWAMAEDEETWRDVDEMLRSVDTFILGRGMYPAYEQYWLALLAKPTGTRMKTLMRAEPIRYHISSFPRPWTRWHGRRHGSFGT
jgi:dihydrofolate reductase